jgi:predicted PurR-regulated permease PerM
MPVSGTVVLLLVGAAVWFFYEVRAVLPPFIFAAVMAYLLNPFVAFLETRGVRRDRAVLALFVLLVQMVKSCLGSASGIVCVLMHTNVKLMN